jgi:hypothetical protein
MNVRIDAGICEQAIGGSFSGAKWALMVMRSAGCVRTRLPL